MSDSLFSSSWYRVAGLRPRLRPHARLHRHVYRGKPWYVLQDLTSQKFHRFEPSVQAVIGLMDGDRTVHEIWLRASDALGDEAPTQDDMIRLLAQLHAADAMQCDVAPDTAELLDRFHKKERRERFGRYMNPFAIRIPLIDPERFLARTLPFVRPLTGWLGVALWLAVVLPALFLAGVHWSVLTEGFLDRILTPQNLFLIWLVFPIIKVLHEFGHGFVARAFGVEVHEMGIMLLVFTPIPYVDASAASALPDRYKRALVGAGGMIVEVFVAALAFYVWLNAESGVVSAVAFNTMVIAGVTTVGFNGNPLLRFDGYYILADLIEIPNLRARSNSFIGYLFERYAIGRRKAEPPATTPGERAWLVGYAVSSFVYRVLVVLAIFLFVLEKSLVLGTILVLIASIGWVGMPVFKTARYLFTDPSLDDSRTRAYSVIGGGAAVLLLLLTFLPMPYRTRSEGVVWIPDEALVRAGTEGFIERVVAVPGTRIRAGDPLIECRDPDLMAEVRVLQARLRLLDARYDEEQVRDRVKADMVEEERLHVRERLARARERSRDLVIHSNVDGVFVAAQIEDLPGRWVRQGEPIAHVLPGDGVTIRSVITQDHIALVRDPETAAQVRLAERRDRVLDARIKRIVPAASQRLPSTALGSAGGGEVAVDPRDERGIHAVEKLFVIDLELPRGPIAANLGERVYVRFAHAPKPLFTQWYRQLRQLFLSRLDV
jgi:putative peptide zinc metalloprotease protein